MPENRQNQANGVSTSSKPSADKLEEAMWRLKIQSEDNNQVDGDDHSIPYPERPGEPDCIYYLRTGLCSYGSNCRFNHPPSGGQATESRGGGLPDRVGQPDCKYFLKTGTCKFGSTCKYHHPQDRHDSGLVSLNILGLPMRQDEKSCSYYMRTGSCKFGVACKFNHPQPATLGAVLSASGPSAYSATNSSTSNPALTSVGGLSTWSLQRSPYPPGPRMMVPPAYMPVVLSPSQGMIPAQPGWSTYVGGLSPVSSNGSLVSNLMPYNSKLHQSVESASSSQLHLLSTGTSDLPERPDEPECQYFMKNGSCKYGPTCKYHHPKERNMPQFSPGMLGPLGLPIRPGQAVCTFYGMYGICKYGPACKFDHPVAGYYGYNVPALSIPDPSRTSQLAWSMSDSSPTKPLKHQSGQYTKSEGTSTSKRHNQNGESSLPQLQEENSPRHATSPSHTADL